MTDFRKFILFVGMGDWNVPELKIAANKGYKSIVTNRNKNALALKKADIPIIADGRDVYSILSFLYQNHLEGEISYVYTGTELFTSVALLTQSLNIPWHSPLSAYICENKNLMRKKFSQNDILHSSGFSVKSKDEIISQIEFRENRKYIIKPSDSLSSQGVTIINARKDIESAFNHALQYSTSKIVICEEYIEGSLYDINGILTKDRLIRLGLCDKETGSLPYTVSPRGWCPSRLSKNLQEKAYSLFEKSCRAVGLSNGPVKGDLIMDCQGRMYIIEIAPRLHGPVGSLYLIPEALGIHPFTEVLNWQNHENVAEHDIDKRNSKIVFSLKVDTKKKLPEEGKILKMLEKPGLKDSKLWKSNYDVPVTIIYEVDIP